MFQGIHNRLQNEKSRLATAIQACEAATASISRPTSPLEEIDGVGQKRELEAKLKLEDLIDQVRQEFCCFVFQILCFLFFFMFVFDFLISDLQMLGRDLCTEDHSPARERGNLKYSLQI